MSCTSTHHSRPMRCGVPVLAAAASCELGKASGWWQKDAAIYSSHVPITRELYTRSEGRSVDPRGRVGRCPFVDTAPGVASLAPACGGGVAGPGQSVYRLGRRVGSLTRWLRCSHNAIPFNFATARFAPPPVKSVICVKSRRPPSGPPVKSVKFRQTRMGPSRPPTDPFCF